MNKLKKNEKLRHLSRKTEVRRRKTEDRRPKTFTADWELNLVTGYWFVNLHIIAVHVYYLFHCNYKTAPLPKAVLLATDILPRWGKAFGAGLGFTNWKLWTVAWGLSPDSYRERTATSTSVSFIRSLNFGLQTSDFLLRSSVFGLRTLNFWLLTFYSSEK